MEGVEVAGGCDVRVVADKGNGDGREDLLADRLSRLGVLIRRQVHIDGLLAVLGSEKP